MFVNVLISSVSKKVSLIKSARRALKKTATAGKIIGADLDPHCIGRFFVDHFWEMPRLDRLSPGEFVSYCRSYGINLIIPTRDGELLFYAKNKAFFLTQGLHVMVSNPESIEICLDKLLFYRTLQSLDYPVIKTAESLDELECEFFVVKERYGAGGRNIGLNLTRLEALKHAEKLMHPIFQPFIQGKEISVDLYLDRESNCKGLVLRHRELVVNGESQVTTTFREKRLEDLCAKIAQDLGLSGHVMLQFIYTPENDSYHVLESNPRFGGASLLSLEVGLDSFYWFFMEESGKDLKSYPFIRSKEEKRLIRYPEDLILSCPIDA